MPPNMQVLQLLLQAVSAFWYPRMRLILGLFSVNTSADCSQLTDVQACDPKMVSSG